MLELLNARYSFLCRTTRTNAEGKSPLMLRVTYHRDRRDLFTGLYCEMKEWNPKSSRLHRLTKYSSVVNDNLDHIQRKAFDVFEAMKYSGVAFTIDELVSKIKGEGEKPELLMDYLEEEKRPSKSG